MKEKNPHTTRSITKRVAKPILWLMAILILLFIAVVGAVQIPQIQTRLVQYLAKTITERTGFHTSIEGVHIKWFDTGVLDSVTIMDDENRPMIIAHHLTVDFDIRTSFNNGNILIDEAQVKGGVLNLRKDAVDATLNITRFIDTVKSIIRKPRKPKERSTPPLFTVGEVSLEEITFQYHDAGANLLPDRFDYNHFIVYDIYADASDLQIVGDTLQVD
ncbi:MAG: hypothetical protein WBA23_03810, partial [Tunicatimonas sp.]